MNNTEMQIMTPEQGLAEALGLDPPRDVVIHVAKPAVAAPIASDNQISTDSTYVRDNIIDVIQKGSESLDQIMELARESAHPRAYEVLAQLLKVQSDNVDKLLKLHADMKSLNTNTDASLNASNVSQLPMPYS